jgi:hypothetical protein
MSRESPDEFRAWAGEHEISKQDADMLFSQGRSELRRLRWQLEAAQAKWDDAIRLTELPEGWLLLAHQFVTRAWRESEQNAREYAERIADLKQELERCAD